MVSPVSTGSVPIPLWLPYSGLPVFIAEKAKTPLAWLLFWTVVQLDCQRHRTPGIVEITPTELGALCGMTGEQVLKNLPKLRKTGTLRCFLPDNAEEDALLQVITPLETPIPWQAVRDAQPFLRALPDHAFRYAHACEDQPPPAGRDQADPLLREVIDLYFDNVSMKMNAFILDELSLIARQYDLPMIRRVFAKARVKEVQGLSWILGEIRREKQIKERAAANKTGAEKPSYS
jgi:hypothetical protein